MAILYVGSDLAKNVFAIHGVDEHGKAVLVRPSVPRAKLHQFVAALPPCTIGMEACLARTTGQDCSCSTATPCV